MVNNIQEAEVSSSSTLWATASKEWVIPAKPKPGRKPKKDTSTRSSDETEQPAEAKVRRTQNRAAQRAFRERKQSHLAELQARIQLYEQGDVERNVALQNVAKRLKEENETLQTENIALQARLSELEAEVNSLRGADKKRGRSENDNPSRKKSRIALDASDATRHSSTVPSPLLTSSSVSSPDSPGSPRLSFEPLSLQGVSRDNSFDSQLDASEGTKSTIFGSDPSFESFSHCGLCDETVLVCVCREVDIHELGTTLPTISVSKSQSTKSILDDLPKYQPPVPLRRRRRRSTNVNRTPVFPIFNQSSDSSPVCTGDPQNCQACAADDFGKAFCIAVNQSAAAACENCPGTSSSPSRAGDGCCGKGIQCWKICPSSPASGSAAPSANSASSSSDMISCDSAWRQFKSHPNVESSDLSLLAEVVARRSKCTGPQVVISPAPGFITPERTSTPTSLPPLDTARENKAEEGSAKHSDGSHHSGASFPAKLVPQEVLARCGREQRVRAVHVDAVQAALRLLDAKSTFYKM